MHKHHVLLNNMPWVCQRCGHEYDSEPVECRQCSLRNFKYERGSFLPGFDESRVETTGNHELKLEGGPDVATDGSVKDAPGQLPSNESKRREPQSRPRRRRRSRGSTASGAYQPSLVPMWMRYAAMGLVILGAYNMLVSPVLGAPAFAPYRLLGYPMLRLDGGIFFLDDILAIAVGAIIIHFS